MITDNSSNFDDLEEDLERELNVFRSGSAPPTVEGSRTAIRNLLGFDDLSNYYVNDNLNPRFRTVNSTIGDRRKKAEGSESSSSLFLTPPGFARDDDGLTRMGGRRKSFADAIQEDLVHLPPTSAHPTRPTSRNAYESANNINGLPDVQFGQIPNAMDVFGGLPSGATSPGLVRVQSLGSTVSQSFASAVGSSLPRSTTPDPNLFRRSSSLCRPVGERLTNAEKKIFSDKFGGTAFNMSDCGDVTVSLSGLNLSDNVKADGENLVQGQFHHDFFDKSERLYNMCYDHSNYLQQKTLTEPESQSLHVSAIPPLAHNGFSKNAAAFRDLGVSTLPSNGQISLQEQSSSMSLSNKAPIVGSNRLTGSLGHLTDMANIDFAAHNSNVFQPLPTMLNNQLDEGSMSSGLDGQYFPRTGSRVGSGFQASIFDPVYAQYLHRAADYNADLSDTSLGRSYLGTSQMDISRYNKAYLGALLAQQKLSQDRPYLGKSGALRNGLYGNSSFGPHMPYPSLIPGDALRQNDPLSRVPYALRSVVGGSKGSWNHVNGIVEQGFASTLLEEFKTNKTRSFELAEIADHVVEFSGDQYGSRFIQQKLETASIEEKNKLFPEILAHAQVLMTDVFGNYVIQKFFEHGTESHRSQLAGQLLGHVLPLSLQMYGCRVIQKALEVVDVEQQTQMVLELDGSIMKCVRDQNGNHVIQKCIECVPQERIQFIISAFYGQVLTLSTHPYGCRVIQRVLEHCDDAKTQSIMIDEIMRSVCTLAQDQYGNYVIQHVLQHGKQEERAAIISMLAGQIVKMSQQKFASNVVEKCLTYGTPAERQILIDEMLGSTDENEPLQAMMKDQFGNYVVQKVLETCDDQNRELILSRVKVHLNALKRYTYGKHIVARVEKLITAGERRIGTPVYNP